MPVLQGDFLTLHFTKRGHGEPLVLLHGLFGSAENLGALTRLLCPHFTTYAIDLPNHGRSPHSDVTSLEKMMQAVMFWMEAHNLHSVHVLGHSLGGKVAMELALRHPQRVSSLVVLDISPVHYDAHHNQVFNGLLAVDLDAVQTRSAAEEVLARYVTSAPVRSFLLKNLIKTSSGKFAWRMNLNGLYRAYPQLIGANAERCVYSAPTLFLKGGASDYIHERQRHEIVSRFPNASLKIVANTGHWLHAEKPELVCKLVEKFLNQ